MPRIMVVDDEPRICRFVSRALERDGHVVRTVGTGEQALLLADAEEFALVVLDLMLPRLGGVDVLRQMLARRPDQRVLVLSAIGDVAAKVECFAHGAVDYLAKPFALAELVARVRIRAAEPAPAAARRCIRAGQVALDPHRRTAELPGRSVQLTQREFVLLSHLMGRAGHVCGREELLTDVWGHAFDAASNVVDVYVRRLRAKLGADSIETIRNVGYSFVAG
ncbi:DNA-binding response regulator [Sphaerisporangium krabiense]|uniref:Two-component system copper resistance phosphate regulon response regulator CusR n=1 Tax=Sphaerisporangium krabiense TaxID=763782 RepID=A0A7W9DP91_9ACTN|nr:response regulator transcription factor [Sphaerisporangium krabiense]MBB5626196.1 two-component system copper resistance phosphate regulon response regulator CusR [Sphaerisporangium krabiense]GII66137.1 DNA-binding response regulator [Sphaerisporangium krabiense]